MFPSKNMMDYITEINRLFPRAMESDVQPPSCNSSPYMYSPYNMSTANRSSSSADSFSPESFPDMSSFNPTFERNLQMTASNPPFDRNLQGKRPFQDTPCQVKRQRPIVGRKIFVSNESPMPMDKQIPVPQENTILFSPASCLEDTRQKWEVPYQQTPPNTSVFADPKNYNPNVLYELFPSENKGFEFRTPVKASKPPSFVSSANISPSSSISPVSTNVMHFPTPPPPFRRNITPHLGPGPSKSSEISPGKVCTFCRKNGETPMVYMTHTVKERVGNRNVVTCPILRSHVCSTCGASGDDAHTITYCPILRSSNNGRPLQSTTITLKNTRVKSNGRKRF